MLLDDLPDSLFLERLEISGTAIESLHVFSGSAATLKKLVIENQSFPNLKSLSKFSKLAELGLAWLDLKSDDFFGNIGDYLHPSARLTRLDLSGNDLDDYDSTAMRRYTEELVKLNLAGNKLVDDSFIDALPMSLVSLDVAENNFESLEVSDRPMLKRLRLTSYLCRPRAQCMFLPGHLASVKKLSLKNLGISYLHLSHSSDLEEVHVEGLALLETIELSDNKNLKYAFGSRLPNLKSLRLHSNALTTWNFDDSMSQLSSISLDEAGITSLVLSSLPLLQQLDLRPVPCEFCGDADSPTSPNESMRSLALINLPSLGEFKSQDMTSLEVVYLSYMTGLAKLEIENSPLLYKVSANQSGTPLKFVKIDGVNPEFSPCGVAALVAPDAEVSGSGMVELADCTQ